MLSPFEMKKTTRNWLFFAVTVLVLFFFSVCLLFLQINSNDKVINSIKTFSNTAKAAIIGLEGSIEMAVVPTQNKHPFEVLLPTFSDQTQSWLVTNPDGVRIEVARALGSELVDHLPWGSIVTGNAIQTFPDGGSFTRLLIMFPSVGWLTLSHHPPEGSTQYYVQPLNTTYTPNVVEIKSAIPPNTCSDPSTHLPHTDFKGGDLSAAQLGTQSNPVHTNNNADCCVQCCRTSGCVYWTRIEGGDCWLKGSTAVKTDSPGLNLVSGVASAAGCMNNAQNNNKNAAGAGITVNEYASSAMCAVHNATIRETSICTHVLHPLYEAVFREKCASPHLPKLGFSNCRPYTYRPFSQNNRCEIKIPESVHVLQRGQALSGKIFLAFRNSSTFCMCFVPNACAYLYFLDQNSSITALLDANIWS